MQVREVGGRLLAICGDCGKLVRVDKPFLGGLHFCLSEEERARKKMIQQMYANQQQTVTPSWLADLMKGDKSC